MSRGIESKIRTMRSVLSCLAIGVVVWSLSWFSPAWTQFSTPFMECGGDLEAHELDPDAAYAAVGSGTSAIEALQDLMAILVPEECSFCDLYTRCTQNVYFNEAFTHGTTVFPYEILGVHYVEITRLGAGAGYSTSCNNCP